MPIILKSAQAKADLKAFCVGRLASIQAELSLDLDAQIKAVKGLVAAGYLLTTENLSDLNVFQVFKGVDWEETIEENMAAIEEDSWRLMKIAKE